MVLSVRIASDSATVFANQGACSNAAPAAGKPLQRWAKIFHQSQTPLSKWFLAMYFMTTAKNDVVVLELMRHLDVKWDTAWLIKQKLMEAMFQRNSIVKLEGDIQIDDAYQGGEKPAIPGKSGRGARNKVPFIVAVQTRNGRPIFAHIRCISGFDPRRRFATMRNHVLPARGS